MKKLGLVFLLTLAAASIFSGCESQEAKERLTEVETALENSYKSCMTHRVEAEN